MTTDWELTGRERRQLAVLVSHTHDARILQRAYTMLWLDEGDTIADIAAHWHVSRRSVYNWCTRFAECQGQPLETRLADGMRSGRPRTALGIIDPLIDAVIDSAPSAFGYRTTLWTAPLLVRYLHDVHQIDVSLPSVRLAIARLRVRWKRPRHRLALRPTMWRQSKGGLNTASLNVNAPSP